MVEVVVPWSPGCRHREQALYWVEDRYREIDLPVRRGVWVAEEWCKGKAITAALRASTADIVVQADADVWTDGLAAAISTVEAGAPWAIPHGDVYRLDEEGTAAVLAGADWREQPLAQRPYRGIAGGGIVVAPRDVFEAIRPDSRFKGWGQEDESWACALKTLLGEPWRGDADLVHLWHPPQARMTRRRGSRGSWNLRRRYFAARDDPAAMAALIEESRDRHPADEQTGDHHPALR